MKLARNLAVGLLLAGVLVAAAPAEARHRHHSRCEHRSYQSHRYDRHHHYDYRYDRRDYGYRDEHRYDRRDYGHRDDYRYEDRDYRYRDDSRYRSRRSYHHHGRSRCWRSHVGVFFGF